MFCQVFFKFYISNQAGNISSCYLEFIYHIVNAQIRVE